jgi:DNA (cytosine-5)-methyltransferase 1
VDRLLKSPAIQRGRDFAIMISSLNDLGYAVEWRVVNAAEYGMPQRRRRTFILGYKKNSPVYKKILQTSPDLWVGKLGIAATTFPFKPKPSSKTFTIQGSLVDITKNFNQNSGSVSPFLSAGISIGRDVFTTSVNPTYDGKKKTLGDIIISEENIPESYYISQKDLAKWKYLKGAKNKPMKSKSGFSFVYTEGSMVFPDPLDRPSRTIITAEGGSTPSRFKHVIKTESGRLRRLTPLELERLNMFPDNHTIGQSDTKRAFFMGNALVVGVVTKLGKTLLKHL